MIYILLITFNLPNNYENNMNSSLANAVKIINTKNIFFGHQSVGNNILQGIRKSIDNNNSSALRITNLENFNNETSKYFIESKIGFNGDPKSKIYDFCQKVELLSKNNLHIAMMKLCYADIKSNSDINEIFNYYNESIDSLQKKYPKLIIIHFTVPLTAKRNLINRLKDFFKGRPDNSMMDNIARNNFNQLLVNKYPTDRIFQLAKIESTYPNGRREEFDYQGKTYNSLITDYTDDGGHLNEKAQELIAQKLIYFLSDVSK